MTALIYRLLTKPAEIRRVKEEAKALSEKAKAAQKAGDMKESSRLMTEMLKSNNAVFRMNMKPMIVSMLLFFLAYYLLLAIRFADMSIAAPFSIPFIGTTLSWFWWYFIIVLAGNFIFRKLLGVE